MLAAMAATFLLVPRGFSAGEIDIQADKMSWNVRTPAAQQSTHVLSCLWSVESSLASKGCILRVGILRVE